VAGSIALSPRNDEGVEPEIGGAASSAELLNDSALMDVPFLESGPAVVPGEALSVGVVFSQPASKETSSKTSPKRRIGDDQLAVWMPGVLEVGGGDAPRSRSPRQCR
jgi:hypothetical protein